MRKTLSDLYEEYKNKEMEKKIHKITEDLANGIISSNEAHELLFNLFLEERTFIKNEILGIFSELTLETISTVTDYLEKNGCENINKTPLINELFGKSKRIIDSL
jgi:hypothetical protein